MKGQDVALFRRRIWAFYKQNKRPMPWRKDTSPYSIFVSEVMLQQTQVSRVVEKYREFIRTFPTFEALAGADTKQLLTVWQGLGYNRRALYLRAAAQVITKEYYGDLPADPLLLDALPGIGYATACSISAFAYNTPVVFIETNIRRVFIHHFFHDKTEILDTALYPFVEQTLVRKKSREWYWALMDYGTYLATQIPNPNIKSKHYVKQTAFVGSVRQVRGEILRLLLDKPYSHITLYAKYRNDNRFPKALAGLLKEGLIREENNTYFIQ
jgi:A/G-specific adenine glycosylase